MSALDTLPMGVGRDLRSERLMLPPRPLLTAAMLIALSLTLLLLGECVSTDNIRFGVGDRRDARMLVNFYGVQKNGVQRYRWSQPTSQLFLYGYNGRLAYLDLRLIAPRPLGVPIPNLAIQVGQQEVVRFPVITRWRHYHLLAPTTPNNETALRLITSSFRPGVTDHRTVGVAISGGMVGPADTGTGLLDLQRDSFLIGTLPLLAWLLLWRIGAGAKLAFAVAIAFAGVVGWAAVDSFDANYLLPTVGWPWWPLLPLLFLIALPPLSHSLMRWARWLPNALPFAPWPGVVLALTALVGIRLGLNVTLGLVGLLAATVVVVASIARERSTGVFRSRPTIRAIPWLRVEAASLVVLVVIAGALRLYRLDTQPLGLWRDEARHGLLALRIWQNPTFRPIYVVAGADLPALLFYLIAPVVGIFGPHLWTVRLVSALAGTLTPLALWWAVRPLIGARAALYAAALLAWASWSLSMSRWAFPVTLDQLFVLLALGLMWRALAPVPMRVVATSFRARVLAVGRSPVLGLSLAALCAGLATYTYHTGRIAPLILGALTVLRLGWNRVAWRRAIPMLVVALLVGVLVVLPLVRFILSDYAGYTRRTNVVAILNSGGSDVRLPLVLLGRNALRYLLMLHVHGEPNGRHHAPGAPMLDPFTGLLFLIGLGIAALHRRSIALVFIVWLGLALVPGIFSTDAPHAMRSLGALAPACALAGLGLAAFCSAVQCGSNRTVMKVVPYAVCLSSFLFNGWLYFGNMSRNPAVYSQFGVATTAMARVAQTAGTTTDPTLRAVHVFLTADKSNEDVQHFLLSGISVGDFQGTKLSAPPGDQALLLVPMDAPIAYRQAALHALGPGAVALVSLPCYPRSEGPLFLAYARGDAPARLLNVALPAQIAPRCTGNQGLK